MVDAAAEHDQPDALSHLDFVLRMHAAHDAPREVAGDLHDGVASSERIAKDDQIALVMRARIVAICGEEIARRMLDACHLTSDRRAIHMNIEG